MEFLSDVIVYGCCLVVGLDGVEDLDDVERQLGDEERRGHDQGRPGHRSTGTLHRRLATSSPSPQPHQQVPWVHQMPPATQRRRNGGGDGGARPRNVETTAARAFVRPRNIFLHFCMLFLKLPLFVVMSATVSSFFTNKIHIATEHFNKQKTHRPILPIRNAYVISKMANFYVCCDEQQYTRTQLMHRPTVIKCSPPQC